MKAKERITNTLDALSANLRDSEFARIALRDGQTDDPLYIEVALAQILIIEKARDIAKKLELEGGEGFEMLHHFLIGCKNGEAHLSEIFTGGELGWLMSRIRHELTMEDVLFRGLRTLENHLK